jgi:phosphatidylinositol-bisphosphatase
MLVVVIVKKALQSCFTDIQPAAAGAGIMGVLVCESFLHFHLYNKFIMLQGNKGGTAIRLTFTPPISGGDSNGTTFTFVNSHLAAFDEQYEKRNLDFHDLCRRLNFDSEIPDETGLAPLPISLYQSDVLFWMVGLSGSGFVGLTHS